MSKFIFTALLLAASGFFTGTQGAEPWNSDLDSIAHRSRRLQLSKVHTKVSTISWDASKRFKFLVDQAEDLYAASDNAEAAVTLLRAAFLLCPDCEYDEFSGKKLGAVFADDKQESTQFLLQHVLPVLKQYAVEEQEGSGRILWAGCQPSALRYQYQLGSAKLVTIDASHGSAVYCSSRRHISDALQHVDRHAKEGTFDVAVVDQVLGKGIDSQRQLQEMLRAVHSVMSPEGILLVGWDRFRTSCCEFQPYFVPASMDGLPHRTDLNGTQQHSFALFKWTAFPAVDTEPQTE